LIFLSEIIDCARKMEKMQWPNEKEVLHIRTRTFEGENPAKKGGERGKSQH